MSWNPIQREVETLFLLTIVGATREVDTHFHVSSSDSRWNMMENVADVIFIGSDAPCSFGLRILVSRRNITFTAASSEVTSSQVISSE